jgi:hypothetical protein
MIDTLDSPGNLRAILRIPPSLTIPTISTWPSGRLSQPCSTGLGFCRFGGGLGSDDGLAGLFVGAVPRQPELADDRPLQAEGIEPSIGVGDVILTAVAVESVRVNGGERDDCFEWRSWQGRRVRGRK